MYEADDLKKATGDFANDNYLGEDGFSVVYGGTLRRTPVAVKVLKKVLSQYLVHAYYCSHHNFCNYMWLYRMTRVWGVSYHPSELRQRY